jgi:putative oxidoreductase
MPENFRKLPPSPCFYVPGNQTLLLYVVTFIEQHKRNGFKMNDIGILVLRVVAGSFMAFGHGLGKVEMFFSGKEIKFINFLGIGEPASLFLTMFAEFFMAIFIIFGISTKLSSIPLIIAMFVAAFVAHAADPFQVKEMALLFLTIFTTLFITGGGKYAVSSLYANKIAPNNEKLACLLK